MSTTRGELKRTAILDAAAEVFLAKGYVGTSMDEVAAVARVSKQTVYKHFRDKEALFHELIIATVQRSGEEVAEPVLPGERPWEEELRAYARLLLHGVMQPSVLRLRRVVIGEATRFPALGRAFYDRGLARTVATLSPVLSGLAEAGLLAVDDAPLAAEQFVWLVLSVPLNRAMLLGDDHGVAAEDLDRYADAGVDAFLAAYAPG
jgi:TetR/AcrR family transcriptional regulator, mexJK operon transcriptional repressor